MGNEVRSTTGKEAAATTAFLRTIVLVALCAVIHWTHGKLDQAVKSAQENNAPAMIPSADSVKFISLGYDQLIADVYWLAFINYYGDGLARQKDHLVLADRYLDLITDLDPQFVQPYWFAAFTIGGDMGQPQRADEIVKKGIVANPNNWYLPFIAGMNQYLFAKDEKAAARYYRMASKFPEAPSWLEGQVKILESDAPKMIKEGNNWLAVYNSTDEERVKEHVKEKCIRIWVKIFKMAPTEKIRARAAEVLNSIGVDVRMFRR